MSSDANTLGICWEILLRLPAGSLFRFRAVCKGWQAVIDDPGFVKAHTNHHSSKNTLLLRNSTGHPFYPLYSFNLEDVNFTNGTQTILATPRKLSPSLSLQDLPVAVCNGLMLIAPVTPKKFGFGNSDKTTNWDPRSSFEIWNPLTHDSLKVLQPSINLPVGGYGFGYDCAADDYKVVVIYHSKEKHMRQTHVYSLKSGLWRKIENCPFELDHSFDGLQRGAFVNGALHWISQDEKVYGIIVLDLRTEKYRQLKNTPSNEQQPRQLDALGGCLLIIYHKRLFDVWVMDDNDDSWILLFSINAHPDIVLVAYMKSKKGALLQYRNGFFWFDAESSFLKEVTIHGICGYSEKCSAQICVGSLFRFRESVATGFQTRKRKRDINCREMMKMTAHNKLTLCVRDVDKVKRYYTNNLSHDCCYSYDSNRYNSSADGDKVRITPLSPRTGVPLDVCHEIFIRMPAKTLIRLRAVCKLWRTVIDDPFFVKAHFNKHLLSNTGNIIIRNSTGPPFYPLYSFDLDVLNFTNGLQRISATPLNFTASGLSRLQVLPIATCNGLMLLAPISPGENAFHKLGWDWDRNGKWDRKGTWEILNPLTHERLQLPQLNFDSHTHLTAWGLGYDCTTDDYKAVVIDFQYENKPLVKKDFLPVRDKREYQTHVYSLKSDSWRSIGICPYDEWGWLVGRSVFLNGVLYWLTQCAIVALDLETENYRQLQQPVCQTNYLMLNLAKQMDVLDGCLIVGAYFHDDCRGHFVVWEMKDDGDGAQGYSWVKLFSTYEHQIGNFLSTIRAVAFLKNKMQILLHDDHLGFYLFDLKSKTSKMVSIHGLTGNIYAQQVFPGSIFRIHDNCGVTGRRRTLTRENNMKMPGDTELTFCVRNKGSRERYEKDIHDGCYTLDANMNNSASED